MPFAIGVDFGTESGRAVLVDVASGDEVATAVYPYLNGVIDESAAGFAGRPRAGLGAPETRTTTCARSSRRFRGCCRRPGSRRAR